jgi:MoaA/NifB/PqqE/SkfB family radical SAM enzyme
MSETGRIVRRLAAEGLWNKLANFLLVEAELRLGRRRLLGRPYWLTVDPTSACQLRCPFCPTGMGRNVRPKASLSLERFRRIMDELGPTLIHIDFMNWGEPLLNKDLWDMIAQAKRHRIDTMVSTNLNALTEGDEEELVSCGLDRLVLSIDGLCQETYEKYRVGGDYAKVTANLRRIVEARRRLGRRNPWLVWQFLVFKHNEHEIDSVRETALKLGVDEVGITPANMPFKPGIREDWLPTRREYSLYDPETFPDSPPWHWEKAQGQAQVDVQVYARREERSPCPWPWTGITINPDGAVSPCCSVEESEYDFGDFFAQPFRALWNGPLYLRARDHVLRYASHRADTIPGSSHACERCFSIGRARFQLPHTWLGDGAKP